MDQKNINHIWFGISARSSWKERPARLNKSHCTILSRIEARSKFPSVLEVSIESIIYLVEKKGEKNGY